MIWPSVARALRGGVLYSASVTSTDFEARAAELREQINRALKLYHEDAPEMADAEYDRLLRELRDLEELPRAADPRLSHAARGRGAGGCPRRGPPSTPMLSLNNAFSADELRAFDARVSAVAGFLGRCPAPS